MSYDPTSDSVSCGLDFAFAFIGAAAKPATKAATFASQAERALTEDVAQSAGQLGGRAGTTAARDSTQQLPPTTRTIAELPDRYAGVREASQYLRDLSVSRSVRKEILASFERGTVQVRRAGDDTFALRYFGKDSDPLGRYLFPTFPASRSSIALPSGNAMSGIAQFQLRPGATYFVGRAGPNFGQPGGGIQYFVPNLDDLVRL